jgi:hypothetical protein
MRDPLLRVISVHQDGARHASGWRARPTAARTQSYWFNLPSQSRIELRLFNQVAFARAFIWSGRDLAVCFTS